MFFITIRTKNEMEKNEMEFPIAFSAVNRDLLTQEDIIEVCADTEEQYEKIKIVLEELESAAFIRTRVLEDQVGYHAREGLTWSDIKHIDDPLKKKILLQMIPNPKTFFVLFNTQKGKAKITASEIKEWIHNPDGKRVVAIVMLDNDLTLGDQTAEGFAEMLGHTNVKLFTLSSSSDKTGIDEIITYIDAYSSCPNYRMPLIMALANPIQCKKVLKIISHVRTAHMSGRSQLMYGMAWDEADKIYPMLRDKCYQVDAQQKCIRNFTSDDDTALYRLGFITATEGSLLDEEYPECANAYLYPAEISDEDEPYYRAFHHPEAIKQYIPCGKSKSNNDIALKLINDKLTYFKTPITLTSGEIYYRKMIINSNAKGVDMRDFAGEVNRLGFNAMVFNQNGLTVIKPGEATVRFKTKKRRFNRVVFYAYKRYALHLAPLVIIGRKKVDRGLGFSYAPRKGRLGPTSIDEGYGPIETDGIEGLIWTDEFLGHIEDKNTAVQKAGRLAGIIAQCPQYPGSLTWWTSESTGNQIDRHCRIVDSANEQMGVNTVLQAFTRAKAATPVVAVEKELDYGLSDTFDTIEEAQRWCQENLTYSHSEYRRHSESCSNKHCKGGCGDTHIKYRGNLRALLSEDEIRNNNIADLREGGSKARIFPVTTDFQWGIKRDARVMPVKIQPPLNDVGQGANTSARIMPVVAPTKIVYIVIYKRDKLKPTPA
jgi:hypothetical protein